MARFFLPLVFFAICSLARLASCEIPSIWDELLGSDTPLFPETISSAQNGPVLHSRVLRELSSRMNNPEISSQIYEKYLAAWQKPETRNNINTFKKNLMLIAKRNLLYHTGKSSWEEGINQFTDMPSAELRQYYGGMPAKATPPAGASPRSNLTLTPEQIPDELDWRNWGAVAPVEDQGQCGSCWSFSALSTVEGAVALSNGPPAVSLSKQELVSCFQKNCNGAFQWDALDWIKTNGISTTANYPYTAGTGRAAKCQKKKTKAVNTLSYIQVELESDYKANTVQYGPFSASLYFHDDMSRQKRGVYDGPCGQDADGNPAGFHAISLVGYGSEGGMDYWILKNSWGKGFGDKGYIKIRRGVDKCGLQSYCGGTFTTSVQ